MNSDDGQHQSADISSAEVTPAPAAGPSGTVHVSDAAPPAASVEEAAPPTNSVPSTSFATPTGTMTPDSAVVPSASMSDLTRNADSAVPAKKRRRKRKSSVGAGDISTNTADTSTEASAMGATGSANTPLNADAEGQPPRKRGRPRKHIPALHYTAASRASPAGAPLSANDAFLPGPMPPPNAVHAMPSVLRGLPADTTSSTPDIPAEAIVPTRNATDIDSAAPIMASSESKLLRGTTNLRRDDAIMPHADDDGSEPMDIDADEPSEKPVRSEGETGSVAPTERDERDAAARSTTALGNSLASPAIPPRAFSAEAAAHPTVTSESAPRADSPFASKLAARLYPSAAGGSRAHSTPPVPSGASSGPVSPQARRKNRAYVPRPLTNRTDPHVVLPVARAAAPNVTRTSLMDSVGRVSTPDRPSSATRPLPQPASVSPTRPAVVAETHRTPTNRGQLSQQLSPAILTLRVDVEDLSAVVESLHSSPVGESSLSEAEKAGQVSRQVLEAVRQDLKRVRELVMMDVPNLDAQEAEREGEVEQAMTVREGHYDLQAFEDWLAKTQASLRAASEGLSKLQAGVKEVPARDFATVAIPPWRSKINHQPNRTMQAKTMSSEASLGANPPPSRQKKSGSASFYSPAPTASHAR